MKLSKDVDQLNPVYVIGLSLLLQTSENQSFFVLEREHWHEMGYRGKSRAAATSKMESFVTVVNGFQALTIITKRSILDVGSNPRSASGLNVLKNLSWLATLLKRLQQRYFSVNIADVNIADLLRIHILKNSCERLLLITVPSLL